MGGVKCEIMYTFVANKITKSLSSSKNTPKGCDFYF